MKSVRYQKRKHKKSKWMTTGISNSINTKDRYFKTDSTNIAQNNS